MSYLATEKCHELVIYSRLESNRGLSLSYGEIVSEINVKDSGYIFGTKALVLKIVVHLFYFEVYIIRLINQT